MTKDNLETLVARRIRIICDEQIEDLEDRLPATTHPLEKDSILKEIDALHEFADQANERAVELVKKYFKKKQDETKNQT
mgnify:FL=1|tara:strand:+ start:279 stop:515 length:237 start_codon:yes stop_codon:yes gene_type:complete